MRVFSLGVTVLLLCAAGMAASSNFVVPTTTLAAQTGNNTSAANSFSSQSNGNIGAGNVSKVNVHSLLYSGAATKVYAHLMLWFGGSDHMNVGYSSTDPNQVHRQITDMISRGIDGVVIDWYGPNNSIDQATQLVMTEAEKHPGFTFAIMVDQGAIQWDSCKGCTPQQALIADLQYIEQTYFPSKAYMTLGGQPMVTNFGIDDSYTIDWNAVNAALSTKPHFLFANSGGFAHVLSDGSYSWVMPTTSDYGMSYLANFYDTGIPLPSEQTVGATYKGFNDTLASWGSGRIMGQQCGQTWLQTFSKINSLYSSGVQLPLLQLVTWNDYEEGTEIESGISNCLTISANVSTNELKWSIKGNASTVDHYVAYISTDGQNLMKLTTSNPGTNSLNLCSFGVPKGNYIVYMEAVGKPTLTNQMSPAVKYASTCGSGTSGGLTFSASPSTMTVAVGGSGNVTISATPQSGSFSGSINLACSGLPANWTCAFAPAAIAPGGGSATSVLTIGAASVASLRDNKRSPHPLLATSLLGFGVLGMVTLGKVPRRRLWHFAGACALLCAIGGVSSCGGSAPSGRSLSSNPSAYTVTVLGTGAAQVSTTITVIVR